MKNHFKSIALFLLLGCIVFLLSCEDEEDAMEEPMGSPPTAVAPTDISSEVNVTLTLDGSNSSDNEDTDLDFFWSVAASPPSSTATLTSPTEASTEFTPDVEGEYEIELEVTDQDGNSDTDVVVLMISGQQAETQEISGDISELDTLYNFFDDETPDYLATGNLELYSELYVEPGAKVHFQEDVQFYIGTGGYLNAEGTEQDSIIFMVDNPSAGQFWKGFFIQSSDQRNTLAYARISHAGNSEMSFGSGADYQTNIGLDNGGYLNITNSQIADGAGYGLFVHDDDSDLGDFENNRVKNNTYAGIGLRAKNVASLDDQTVFEGNELAVQLFESELAQGETVTWPALSNNAFYTVSGYLGIYGDLIIEAGANFEVDENILIYVGTTAEFQAQGTESDSIIFTSSNIAGNAKWDGLFIQSSNQNNKIMYTEVSYGGIEEMNFGSGADYKTNIGLDNGGYLSIMNSTITKGDGYGVFVHDDESAIGEFSNNHFESNLSGMGIRAKNAYRLDEATTFSNQTISQVEVFGSSLEQNEEVTWVNLNGNATYRFVGTVNINGFLTINPGAELEFNENVEFEVNGVLEAVGTDTENITLTSSNTAGSVRWRGIFVKSSDARNTLEYVTVAYGGNSEFPFPSGADYQANIGVTDGSRIAIENCEISQSAGAGIAVQEGGFVNGLSVQDTDAETQVINANTFSDNAGVDVFFEAP